MAYIIDMIENGFVAESVYAADLKSAARVGLWVRVPPELPFRIEVVAGNFNIMLLK